MYRCTESARVPVGRSVQLAAVEELLTDEEVEAVCRPLGHQWRVRVFPPGVTVRSMVYRGLHADKSIRAVLTDLVAADARLDAAPSDAAWCRARARLPEGLWPELIDRSAHRLECEAGTRGGGWGRPLYLFDGSTLSMPDTPELVEAFGYADTRHGPSRFPVARLSLLVRAGTGAVCDYRLGPYRDSEHAHLHALWHRIPSGSIVLWDKLLCSFYNLAKCRQRGVDVLTPLHQRRDPAKLIAHGTPLGKNEWQVDLDLSPQLRKQYNDPDLPQTLPVRLIRTVLHRNGKTKERWLITTLLDPHRYSRRRIVRLYRRRWEIETQIGSLKTTLQMNILRSHAPGTARSEVAATVLAHNLTQTLIHQAARHTGTPPDRISFVGAVRAAVAFSSALRTASSADRVRVYRRMLRHIAAQTNPLRPGRIEPRLVKRDRRRYGFLKISRDQARKQCLC